MLGSIPRTSGPKLLRVALSQGSIPRMVDAACSLGCRPNLWTVAIKAPSQAALCFRLSPNLDGMRGCRLNGIDATRYGPTGCSLTDRRSHMLLRVACAPFRQLPWDKGCSQQPLDQTSLRPCGTSGCRLYGIVPLGIVPHVMDRSPIRRHPRLTILVMDGHRTSVA